MTSPQRPVVGDRLRVLHLFARHGSGGPPGGTGAELARVEHLLAPLERLQLTARETSSGPVAIARLLGDLRADPPDVVMLGAGVRGAARRAVRAAGWPVLEVIADGDDGPEYASRLALAAGRAGAGLAEGPRVTVVSTVLNEETTIDALLDAITGQLGEGDEAVIVDGGSTDRTEARVRTRSDADPRIRFLSAPGTNISAGRNRGIEAATHEVIVVTDAGCEIGERWLDAFRLGFAEPQDIGLVAGVPTILGRNAFEHAQAAACYPNRDEARRRGLFVRFWGAVFGTLFFPTLPYARSLGFTKTAWRAAGGFPEDLPWTEDGVFGQNVAQRQICALSVDAVSGWDQRDTLRATWKMWLQYGMGAANSGSLLLQTRDALRAAAYVVGLWLLRGPWRGARPLLALGAGVYWSLPLVRVARYGPGGVEGAKAAALVPAAMALKDVGKMSGAVLGHVRGLPEGSVAVAAESGSAADRATAAPKVTLVTSHVLVGGAEHYLLLLLDSAPDGFFDEIVCLGDGPLVGELRARGYDPIVLPERSRADLLRAPLRFRHVAKQSGTQVVIANGLKAAAMAGIGSRLSRRRPRVVWRKVDGTRDGWVANLVALTTDRVAPLSASVGRTVNWPIARGRVEVLHNGVSGTAGDPVAGRLVLNAGLLHPGAQHLVLCGRLYPAKGGAAAIDVLAALRAAGTPAHLTFVGGTDPDAPHWQAELEALAAAALVREHVTFLGRRHDVPDLLAGADLILAPSQHDPVSGWAEGFSNTVAESLVSGTPVLAYDHGPFRELFGEAVRLVPEGDAAALAVAAREILASPAERARMSDQGRVVAGRFTLDRAVSRWTELARDLTR